jgi:aldehyde:ferredoxin oxidoreductase
MHGYHGRILKVDLTDGSTEEIRPPDEWLRDYVGGEGLGMRLYWEYLDPARDVFDPAEPLVFTTGPLTGTPAPASGRTVLVFRSPATGAVGASNCGGFFARELKRAGWDGLIVVGRSRRPALLHVTADGATLLDVTDLWGEQVKPTEAAVKELLGDPKVQVASIGPAGEKLVRFASILTDKHRAFGRGGCGAGMGSKNLKAIAVRGQGDLPAAADPAGLKTAGKAARQECMDEEFVKTELAPYGTPSFYSSLSSVGTLPTRNWHRGSYPESLGELDHGPYHEKLNVKAYACSGCPIGCGRLTSFKEPLGYPLEEGGGPEYETVAAFGSKLLINDIMAVTAANHLANDLGIDTISAGQVIATAMEWYETGILDAEATGGLKLSWGDADVVMTLLGMISRREGVGDLLAEGVKRAAETLGADAAEAAMHVKGVEMPADGVHASHSMTIVQACSARGADHLRPYTSAIDALGWRSDELGIAGDIDPLADGDKAWVKPFQELSMSCNLMGVCLFTVITLAVRPSTWAGLMTVTTGEEWTKERLLEAAERTIDLERLINARFGLDRKDDRLPERFMTDTVEDGPGHGTVIDLDAVLDSYYTAMGWRLDDGLPDPDTLRRLGLEWAAVKTEGAPV